MRHTLDISRPYSQGPGKLRADDCTGLERELENKAINMECSMSIKHFAERYLSRIPISSGVKLRSPQQDAEALAKPGNVKDNFVV